MLKAIKGNRVVRIPDERKNDYVAMGYKITTMDGKTVHEPVKTSELKTEVEKLTGQLKEAEEKATVTAERIEVLQKENADVKAENTALKAEVEKLTGQLKEAAPKQAAQKATDAGKQAKAEAKATE